MTGAIIRMLGAMNREVMALGQGTTLGAIHTGSTMTVFGPDMGILWGTELAVTGLARDANMGTLNMLMVVITITYGSRALTRAPRRVHNSQG